MNAEIKTTILSLTNRFREPYCTLRTEFYGPCASCIGHKSDGKRSSVTYSTNREKRERTFYWLPMKTDVESSKAHDIRLIPIILNNAKLHKKEQVKYTKVFSKEL